MRVRDRDSDYRDILLHKNHIKKNTKNILIYDLQASMVAKPLRIRFDKIDRFIKINDRIRYLVLLDCSRFDKICNRIKYLISGIPDGINHNLEQL